jgi:glycosyltransferase involved in cell wall biosynthesis
MKREPRAHFLLVGKGPALAAMQAIFRREGLTDRVHTAGILEPPLLSSAYQAMDAFLFTSKTETQGMVLAEAMAAGTPVVALDGPGARDVVRDGENGRLVPEENVQRFCEALEWIFSLDKKERARVKRRIRKTARSCSLEECAGRALDIYRDLKESEIEFESKNYDPWRLARRYLDIEFDMFKGVFQSTLAAFSGKNESESS